MTARALNKKEIKRLKAAAAMSGSRETLIVLLGISSGLRAGEIASLNNGDVFDSRGRIRSQFSLDRKRNKNKNNTDFQQSLYQRFVCVSLSHLGGSHTL